MTTVFTEGRHPGEFLLSEDSDAQISRESITIAAGSGVIAPGTVLGKVTASGKYVPSPATGSDGSQVASAIAFYGCDATSEDQKITAIARMAEVKGPALMYASSVDDAAKKAAKAAQLAAQFIIVR